MGNFDACPKRLGIRARRSKSNTMELNLTALGERMCLMDKRAQLINFIFKTQGAEWQRLNPKDAAAQLGCSDRTVRRLITELADQKLIELRGKQLRLTDEVLTA